MTDSAGGVGVKEENIGGELQKISFFLNIKSGRKKKKKKKRKTGNNEDVAAIAHLP